MRIYLAARYSRRDELCEIRRAIEAAGRHVVRARWLDGNHQISDSGIPIGEGFERDDMSGGDSAAVLRQRFAQEDFDDVASCDLFVAFTEPPRSSASRGGRHVELGIALGLGKRIAVVGFRENVFCWLPVVQFYEFMPDLLASLEGQS